MKTRYRLFSCIRVVMRQKSKTCNRRYLFPRTYCQASSYIDGDARAALRETQDLECARRSFELRHSFVVQLQLRSDDHSCRYSSTRYLYFRIEAGTLSLL